MPFDPEGVLGTDHDGDVLTVFTVAGGGASLVLARESAASDRPTPLDEDDLTTALRTGLAYLFCDGVRTVRVRADPDSVADALDALGGDALHRYEDVTFTAKLED